MYKYISAIFLVFIFTCLTSCLEVEELDIENNFVIEAFLYGGEAIDDIKLKTTYPLDASEDLSEPITNASVILQKDGIAYELEPSADPGLYNYNGNDLTVNSGDMFQIEVNFNNRIATSQTTIPLPPTGVAIDVATQQLREALGDLLLTVTWDNPNNDWHYIVVENIENVDDAIFPAQVEEALQNFRFVSEPTQSNSELIIGAGLRHYGTHKVTVYRVNQEYADIFENRTQDSRDLNEPPSNIDNALGIFTGFASESVFFEIVE